MPLAAPSRVLEAEGDADEQRVRIDELRLALTPPIYPLSILRHPSVPRVYNPRSMRRRFMALLAILLLALGVPGTAATRITISTGPWGGVYFLVGTAMAHLLSEYIPGATAIAEPATGSAHSLEFVHRGEATLGLVGLG